MHMRTFLVLLVATFSASCFNRVEGVHLTLSAEVLNKFNDADTELINSALKKFDVEAGIESQAHLNTEAIEKDFKEHLAKFQSTEKPPTEKDLADFKKFFEQLLHGYKYKSSWKKLQEHLTPADVERFETHIGNIKTFGTNANKNAEDIADKIDKVIDEFVNAKEEGHDFTTEEVNTYLKAFSKDIEKDSWFDIEEGQEHLKELTRATKKLLPTPLYRSKSLFWFVIPSILALMLLRRHM